MAMPTSTIERNTVNRQTESQTTNDPEWVHNARMEEYRKVLYAGFDMPEEDVAPERKEERAPVFAQIAPVEPQEKPVSAAERMAAYHAYPAPATRHNLFEGLALKNGELVSEVSAQQSAPAAEAVAAPSAPAIAPEADDEDARPTPRTMAARNMRTQTVSSEQQSFFASLSTRTKAVLATIAAAVLLVITLICINTAVLNSVNAQIADKQLIVEELQTQTQNVMESIEQITSEDYINAWAELQGMSHS